MAPQLTIADAFGTLLDSFMVHLEAENASQHTRLSYRTTAEQFRAWLEEHGRPADPETITRKDVEGFVSYLLQTRSEGTARTRFQALHRFFAWLVEEGEFGDAWRSPMDRMRGPKVHDRPPQMLDENELRALLKACSGTEFEDRRDAALLSIAVDSGFRRGELHWLAVEDVDIPNRLLRVLGKGGHLYTVPIGAKTAQALDRYLRARSRHPHAKDVVERTTVGGERERIHPLWLSRMGQLAYDSIAEMVKRRALQAGIQRPVHTHLLRHSFANEWKRAGGSEEDLARIGRWRDVKTLRRYGAWAADARAREAHRRLSPRDRL